MVEHTTENRGVGGSIPPLTTASKHLILLCSPSLGILDSWLPTLFAAKAAHPEWRVTALIPDRATVDQIDPEDTAQRMANDVIDATIGPLLDGGWVISHGFVGFADLAKPGRFARILSGWAGKRLPKIRSVLRALRTRAQRASAAQPEGLKGPAGHLLYDVHTHGKPTVDALLRSLDPMSKTAHNHGIVLAELGTTKHVLPHLDSISSVVVYGACELPAYEHNFGVRRNRLHVLGVARHEPAWVQEVIERSRLDHQIPFKEFTFVVSRPGGNHNHYLPRARKVASLRAMYEVSWREHGLPLVLRTHPKEAADGTIASALPEDEYGTSWAISRAHPFHLAQHARLGIAFFSGVTLDLIALGVPAIEFIDVRGLPRYDTPDTPRDARGRPQFSPYRRDNLVLPADDISDLRAAFHRIHEDRDAVVAELQAAVRTRFADPTGAIAKTLRLIENAAWDAPHRVP